MRVCRSVTLPTPQFAADRAPHRSSVLGTGATTRAHCLAASPFRAEQQREFPGRRPTQILAPMAPTLAVDALSLKKERPMISEVEMANDEGADPTKEIEAQNPPKNSAA